MQSLINLWNDTGIAHIESGQAIMMLVAFGMLYLAIKKGFEPLLLLPIAVGTLMVNIPGAGMGWSAAEAAIRLWTTYSAFSSSRTSTGRPKVFVKVP